MIFQILGSTDSGTEQQSGYLEVSKPGLSSGDDRPSVCMSQKDHPIPACLGKYVLYLSLLFVFCLYLSFFIIEPCEHHCKLQLTVNELLF